ncbi:MAG: primosomal protein N' (replication factor Y) [Rhodothermales bacterium]|jgi:primosomal protein N' (replication factor Y)
MTTPFFPELAPVLPPEPERISGGPKSVASVLIDLALDRRFDYAVPEDMREQIDVGAMVTVPFRTGTRHGYVVAVADQSSFAKLKPLISIDGHIPPSLMTLADWMAGYYCCARERAVQALLPAPVRSRNVKAKVRKMVALAERDDIAEKLVELETRAPRQAAALKLLVRAHNVSQAYLCRESGLSSGSLAAMAKNELVVISEEEQARDPFANAMVLPSSPLTLNDEQAAALVQINTAIDADRGETILLFGVTGSGKTEVYLQAIARCLELDKTAIVLVPEIALTPQTVERFRARFGDEVSVLHSRLSDGERFDEWTRISRCEVRIVVGARSALFAPFRNLGLIVVDEEHETSYKQDQAPRYHARDVAVMRGQLDKAVVVLGTATPALETFHNVEQGKYSIARLPSRIDDRDLPTMEIVDMAAEAAAMDQPQILSRRLISLIGNTLANNEQAMLFLNRRGYASHLRCLKCNFIAECDDCSSTYTYHRHNERLVCHLCGALRPVPDKCPSCKDPEIRFAGLGTQKLERITRAIFPDARVLRMDSDTMTRKDSYRKALGAFRAGEVDILIGTQMIAKGLHFPNVTLVGIVFADLALNLADFRAGERTFQLLVQVAGRAGRGDLPGRVLVQTYTPFHPVLITAMKQDFEAFYKDEMAERKELSFPPNSHLILIHFRGEDESTVADSAMRLAEFLTPALASRANLFPPMPGPVARKRGEYYYQLMLMTPQIVAVSKYLKLALKRFKVGKGVKIQVDVDAYSMF